MNKQHGAFLTIGELAADLGIPQHILRYWETRFPTLKPLQRAGNRRYYRAEDVELARRIHYLLNVEGYTVRGAQQALASPSITPAPQPVVQTDAAEAESAVAREAGGENREKLLAKLHDIRALLEAAL